MKMRKTLPSVETNLAKDQGKSFGFNWMWFVLIVRWMMMSCFFFLVRWFFSCFVVVIHDEYFLQQVMKVCPLVTSPRSTCEIGAISNLARTASGKRKDLAVSHCHTFCQSFTGFHLRLLVQVQLPCMVAEPQREA